jgi:Rap1a immunity proteins
MRPILIFALLTTVLATYAQKPSSEPIYTSADLFNACSGTGNALRLCFAYIRGFSDGNRWLLRDSPTPGALGNPAAVCVPNAEPIENAAALFVARFKGSDAEIQKLSPFRALSMALSNRYPC